MSVAASMATETGREWISQREAIAMAGCSARTVEHAVATGAIEHRPHLGSRPGLDRESAEAWAATWRAERDLRMARAADLARERERRARAESAGPPRDGHVWLGLETAAILLGCTSQWLGALARAGRLPSTWHGRRWWLRRDHVEQRAAALVFETMAHPGAHAREVSSLPRRAAA